nr:hypothetical protein Iba_scaffold1290CG0070 [Ipomoea batatas]
MEKAAAVYGASNDGGRSASAQPQWVVGVGERGRRDGLDLMRVRAMRGLECYFRQRISKGCQIRR